MSDLFLRARELADIEKVAGVKLFRAGKRLRGECPLCGASQAKKSGGAFSVDPVAKVWRCWACDESGDVIDLERKLGGGTPREAAERLGGPDRDGGAPVRARAAPAPPPMADARDEAWKADLARGLWRRGAPAAGSPVETYLRARGIGGPVLAAALERLRFHAEAYHSGPPHQAVRLPAMVALVKAPAGATGGVHVTYLAPDGRAKTHREPAKRMWGPQGRDGRPGGVWLTDRAAPGPLVVAEGIESALSAAQLLDAPCRVAAALSLGRLQGGILKDAWGRIDPDQVRADPDSPAFTWPDAGEVILAVDRDMRPVRVKARKPVGGGTWQRELTGEDRARICAGLAQQAWRAAGANPVRCIAPGPGRDFNDELRARVGE